MPEHEEQLQRDFEREMLELQARGATMPLQHLRADEAFYLLSVMQVALSNPGVKGEPRAFAERFTRMIADRLGNGRPAIAQVAALGFNDAERIRAGERAETSDPPAQSPEPIAEKSIESPENKMMKSPEVKSGKGRKRS